jgi:hypothetical protein
MPLLMCAKVHGCPPAHGQVSTVSIFNTCISIPASSSRRPCNIPALMYKRTHAQVHIYQCLQGDHATQWRASLGPYEGTSSSKGSNIRAIAPCLIEESTHVHMQHNISAGQFEMPHLPSGLWCGSGGRGTWWAFCAWHAARLSGPTGAWLLPWHSPRPPPNMWMQHSLLWTCV